MAQAFIFKALGAVSIGSAGLIATSYIIPSAEASSPRLEPPKYPWNHRFPWTTYDHAGIRRGFQVYRQICSTCHSLNYVAYRHLINVAYTEEEMKEIAAERDFIDGPNEEGEMFERPGKITDYLPRPYANESAARFANNGSLPPDLTNMVLARKGRENYMFALLTGYRDPPHGVTVRQGLYYNPYFPGGAMAMPPGMVNGAMDYDDGTPSPISQMAKDVTTFLCWTSWPWNEERKRQLVKWMFFSSMLLLPLLYWNRQKWSVLRNRIIVFKDVKYFANARGYYPPSQYKKSSSTAAKDHH